MLGIPCATSDWEERVPDAVQHERAPRKMRESVIPDSAREWCAADPGPPKTEFLAVPVLQRTAVVVLCLIS
jgi:hypothetical protein